MKTPPPPPPPRAKMNWPLFFGLLLAPATITFLAAACHSEGVAALFTFYGSAMAGLACAMNYGQSRGGSTSSRIFWVTFALFVLWPLLTIVSLMLCSAGCAMGGMKGI